jgi:hypothetical protein
MNDQLKNDIADWQLKADAYVLGDSNTTDDLFEEAHTLLLRAQESL